MARISENHWNTLATKLQSGYCTPVIGAGASFPSLPLGSGLSERLIAEEELLTGARCPLPNHTDLAHFPSSWP